jgi:ectoine hydroxylase-related dioxygenase (phytanoyl-CoA dioxygenase family)
MSTTASAQTVNDAHQRLSETQVRSFVENGYLAIPGLVDADELAELKADASRIARGHYPSATLKTLPADLSEDEVLQNILFISQPHTVSPVIEKYIAHPKICSVLSQITAAHLPFWDGSVKCVQSTLFVKPPLFQGQAWHQDESFIPTRDRSLVGAWIAIDDATVQNGCLYVIPASHRSGYLYPQRPHNDPDEFDSTPESYGFDESAEIPLEVAAGTVVFWNGYLLHRSRRNRSSGYRRVLVNHYMNAWSLLPLSPREGERVAMADRRKIIPVAGVDPYDWKGVETSKDEVWLGTTKANTPERDEHAAS